ncbi:MAG: hypothetical protein JXB18_03410 [Sedimentisphaerales bacterium]|nr:hypothetical protein [Sedimentisphaerales bacterium]
MTKKKDNGKMTAKQLEKFRELLLEKRKEILQDVECMEQSIFQSGGELSSMPVHLADMGSDNFEQEFGLGLMAEEKKILVEIDMALRRIEEGTFGICEAMGVPIELTRLEAIPWTRYSLEHARQMEKGRSYSNIRQRPIDIDRADDYEEDVEEEIETEDVPEEAVEMDEEAIELPEEEEDFDDDIAPDIKE